MKTAISIPNDVFASAEELAKKLGRSRSQLYAQALHNFVETHHADDITKKLDAIYSHTDSSLNPSLQTLQSRSLPKDRW
jgi:predicted transcriptional regulator